MGMMNKMLRVGDLLRYDGGDNSSWASNGTYGFVEKVLSDRKNFDWDLIIVRMTNGERAAITNELMKGWKVVAKRED
jgi:hypothetical protein